MNTTYEVLTADFNNDGLMDILELAHGSDASGEPTSRCHWQQENGRFLTQTAQECGLPEFNDVYCAQVGDFDGDNSLDLIYLARDDAALLYGSTTGSWRARHDYAL